MNTPSATVNSYLLIKKAGLDIEVLRVGHSQRVSLVNGSQRIATLDTARCGALTQAEVMQKCRDGRWGRTSAMHKALAVLAAIAGEMAMLKEVTA